MMRRESSRKTAGFREKSFKAHAWHSALGASKLLTTSRAAFSSIFRKGFATTFCVRRELRCRKGADESYFVTFFLRRWIAKG